MLVMKAVFVLGSRFRYRRWVTTTDPVIQRKYTSFQIWYRQKGQNTENSKPPPQEWWTAGDWFTRLQNKALYSELPNSVTVYPEPPL